MQKKHAHTGVTPAVLLDHMRGMEHRLKEDFRRGMKQEIGGVRGELKATENRLMVRIDRAERNLTFQIDAVDQRLDAIEIENLPKRVTRLEKVVRIR
jgi:hypothetical protein